MIMLSPCRRTSTGNGFVHCFHKPKRSNDTEHRKEVQHRQREGPTTFSHSLAGNHRKEHKRINDNN